MTEQEKKNRRIGVLTSAAIHMALFLMFFFMVAWRAPNPPLAEYGIELNFGLDNQGAGDVQPEMPVGDQSEQPAEEEALDQSAETQPDEIKPEVKDVVPEKTIEQAVSKVESPVSLKEEKKVRKTEEAKENSDVTDLKEKVIVENKKDDTPKKGDPGNQGDDARKVGDKGNPEGKLDAKALYGTPGGGGGGTGMDLQMSGWAWADQPRIPELPDNENGRVVFEIECDERGDITGINTVERSLSPRAEQILKDEIGKNSLVRTSGGRVPERSKGRIVFILKTK